MISLRNEQEILETFRPSERDEVQLPLDLEFPIAIKDYMTWAESSGHRVYLILLDPASQQPLGVVFQRNQASKDGGPSMCSWCNSVRSKGKVGLLTAQSGRDRRVGVRACRDLSCKDQLETLPGLNDMRESISRSEKKVRLLQRMSEFVHRNLF